MTARLFSDIFGEADSAAPVAVGVTYATQQVVQLNIPAAGGPFVDVNGDTANNGTEPLAVVPVGWVQAADPITPAEFALVNMSEAVAVGQEALATSDVISIAGAPYTKYGVVSTERLDEWGRSRRMRRVFNHVGPGDFDFIGLGYPDRTAIYVRNTDTVNGINVTYGTGGTTARELIRADGSADNSTTEDQFNIQPSEIVVMEKDGNTVYGSIIPAERVSYFDNYAQANAAAQTPHDGLVAIRDTGEIFGRKTNFNGRVFPADGQENVDWFKVGPGVKSVTTIQQTALGVVDPNTVVWNIDIAKFQKYDTSTDVFNVVFGATHQPSVINWPSNATSGSGLNFKVTEDPDATAGVASITLPDGTEKQIWIIAQQVSGETPNVGGAATIAGTAIIRNDAGVVSLVSIPNESRWHNAGGWATFSYNQVPNLVTDPIGVTNADLMRIFSNVPGAGNWVDATASAGNTVVYPGAADNMQVGVINIRYQDDPALIPAQIPAPVLGQEYVVTVLPVNRGVTTGTIEGETTHYFCVDRGAGAEWVATKANTITFPIRRYTADGTISDEDQRAIFETGANNMTLPVSTQDRLIQIISEGPATVITADGAEQFTGAAGTSTDSILNINETFKWTTILGRGAAAGWSQYVGLVATAQSVGSMVDFSESPGPGDAGSFSLALTNSGANLRYILTLTCSNGTNFSPPLDVDDGTNRWWYDFDHTTGVVNIRRFGAFAGGSVRGVALYS